MWIAGNGGTAFHLARVESFVEREELPQDIKVDYVVYQTVKMTEKGINERCRNARTMLYAFQTKNKQISPKQFKKYLIDTDQLKQKK